MPLGSVSRALSAILLVGATLGSTARAQDSEDPSAPREGYAWGEDEASRIPVFGEDPVRVQAFVGAGVGARFIQNLDEPFNQSFLVPPYLDLGFAVFAPGGDFRVGGGLTISTNLMRDGSPNPSGPAAGQQWALTPAIHFLIPLRRLMPRELGSDVLQITGHVGAPIVIGAPLAAETGIDVTAGGEIGLGLNIKFLAGFGFYLEAQFALFGGAKSPPPGMADTVHPILTFDGGLVIDWEVL